MNRSPSRKPAQIARPDIRICRTRLTVPNAIGLHARPAAMLTKTAQQYDAEITLKCGGRSVNAKSIMGILTLGADKGTRVTVIAEGSDAVDAIRAIEALFACSFHEGPAVVEAAVSAADGPAVVSGESPVLMPATLTPAAPA
jgi:phosphotransferase system HPr (HPr) family protein